MYIGELHTIYTVYKHEPVLDLYPHRFRKAWMKVLKTAFAYIYISIYAKLNHMIIAK